MAVINHEDNEIISQKLKEIIEKDLAGIRTAFINLVTDIIGSVAGPDVLALS